MFLGLSLLFTCSGDSDGDNPNNNNVQGANISGFAQKGPFLNGSSVILSELNESLTQTGLTYTSQIIDNTGAFEITGISLASNYAALRVDGYYFNEVCGEQSNSQITLNAISVISDERNININVLTHLEKARVEYLMTNNSLTIDEAKSQAQSEVLAIFNISESIDSSENLDISSQTAGDAVLIAVSSILQGFRSESEYSELMANIITDIRTDGELNSSSLGSQLISQAALLNASDITNNLQSRYESLGMNISVPEFESYITNFINTNEFSITDQSDLISFSEFGNYGINILHPSVDLINDFNTEYLSLSAQKNSECFNLRIKLTSLNNNDNSSDNEFCDNEQCGWWYLNYFTSIEANSGWELISSFPNGGLDYEFVLNSQNADAAIMIGSAGSYINESGIAIGPRDGSILIEYFEDNQQDPFLTKELTIIFYYPNQSDFDSDNIVDLYDNCPFIENSTQLDSDNDLIGDLCDNCVEIYNPDQNDSDNDNIGDSCEPEVTDMDGDGIADLYDNCAETYNPNQENSDNDQYGDACDSCPNTDDENQSCDVITNDCIPDSDQDGIANSCDNCTYEYNPDQSDSDSDGAGDACDND